MGLWRSGQWREAPRPAPRSTFECRARRARERPGKRGADPRAGSGATLVRRAGRPRPRAPGRERSAVERSALSRRGGARPTPVSSPRPLPAPGGRWSPRGSGTCAGPGCRRPLPSALCVGRCPCRDPQRGRCPSRRAPGASRRVFQSAAWARAVRLRYFQKRQRARVITTINKRKYPNVPAGWISAWEAVIEATFEEYHRKGGGKKRFDKPNISESVVNISLKER